MAHHFCESNGGGRGDFVARDTLAEKRPVGLTKSSPLATGGCAFQGDGGIWRWEASSTNPATDVPFCRKAPDVLSDPEMQANLSNLQRHYEIQREMLSQQFRQQQMRLQYEEQIRLKEFMKLAAHHQHQLSMKEWVELEQRKKEQAEHERQSEKLEQLKKKKKTEESAVASTEVKMKLRECLLNKTQRGPSNALPMINSKHWCAQQNSLEQQGSSSGASPPLRPFNPPYSDAYPLRKTASEPNLKMRSRRFWRHQFVQQQQNGPQNHGEKRRRKHLYSMSSIGSNSESRPDSPLMTNSLNDSIAHRDEPSTAYPIPLSSKSLINHSMPNVAIVPPPPHPPAIPPIIPDLIHKMDNVSIPTLGAMEPRLRLLSSGHLHGDIPPPPPSFYPLAAATRTFDRDAVPLPNPLLLEMHLQAMELAKRTGRLHYGRFADVFPYMPVGSVANLSEAYHIFRAPAMSRTLSEPISLVPSDPVRQMQQLLKENNNQLLRQKLLQLSSSKNQMENVEEIAESHLQQDSKEFSSAADKTELVISKVGGCNGLVSNSHNLTTVDSMDVDTAAESDSDSRGCKYLLNHDRKLSPQEHLQTIRMHQAETGDDNYGKGDKQSLKAMKSRSQEVLKSGKNGKLTTGLVYDVAMLKHQCLCGNNSVHPENSTRLQSIWACFQESALVNRCKIIPSRKATLEELQTCHSEPYVHMYACGPRRQDPEVFETFLPRFCKLPCGGIGVDSDTVWNESYTPVAARTAAGSVIELALSVARGEMCNGFAVVRPPGHHAEDRQAMGFCYFNSIAIAAKVLLSRLHLSRILIVDWDVHHGNSTQQIFYADPKVLYISLHRHDNGHFFPGTGAPEEFGIECGLGFNVNIAWGGCLNPPMGDAEYMAAFRTVVMPIAREFKPEIVLVSAGFDAAVNHPAPLGGYLISPECFGQMTKQLMSLAGGHLVLVLEGGYDPQSTSQSAELCLRALLRDKIPPLSRIEKQRKPCSAAIEALQTTIQCHAAFWKSLTRLSSTIGWSFEEAEMNEQEEVDTVSAFASLSVLPLQPPLRSRNKLEDLSASNKIVEEMYM